jgi:hypothetical protein
LHPTAIHRTLPGMRSFDDIHALAAARHGGPNALDAKLTPALSAADLAAIPDDRWLSQLESDRGEMGGVRNRLHAL